MNIQVLIDAVLQQSTIFIAQLATTGGSRAPIAHLADQVFMELSDELQANGVKKKLIADMFGMTLRTYHRRVSELRQAPNYRDRTVWRTVLEFIQQNGPVSRARIAERFRHDESEVVVGALADLVQTGFCESSGRGESTIYTVSETAELLGKDGPVQDSSLEHLVWLLVYRNGPLTLKQLVESGNLKREIIEGSLRRLIVQGSVEASEDDFNLATFSSVRFDVPVGNENGWEAAVMDHYQAVVTAVISKLRQGRRSSEKGEEAGGATFSMDVGPNHPLRGEATALLERIRAEANDLRDRIDAYNQENGQPEQLEQVIFYVGQFVKADEDRT